MAYIRSSGYKMKDPDDDAFAQVIVGDLERLQLNLYRGSVNTAYVLNDGATNNLNISGGSAPSISVTNTPGSGGSVSQGFCSVQRTNSPQFLSQSDAIIFPTLVEDAASTYNLTTGVFTAPVAGIYAIATTLVVTSATGNTASVLSNYTILKNAATLCVLREDTTVSAGTVPPQRVITLPFSQIMRLAAGDTISATGGILNTGAAAPNDYGAYRGASFPFFTASWIAT